LNRFPTALKENISRNMGFPIHWATLHLQSFNMALDMGMKHYPFQLGFLFEKNYYGQTPLELALSCLAKNDVLDCIEKWIPPRAHFSVLHQVVEHVPHLFNDFVFRYSYCLSQKDLNGRLPLHIALNNGMAASVELLLMGHDRALVEKDPVNGLYPFMIPAARRDGDLTTIYTLLRRNPEAYTCALSSV